MGLQQKIFLYAGLSLLALMSLLTWISIQNNRQANDMVKMERVALVQNVAQSVDDFIHDISPEITGTSITDVQRDQLTSLLSRHKGGFTLELVNASGIVLAGSAEDQPQAVSFHWEVVSPLFQQSQPDMVIHRHSRDIGHLVAFAPVKNKPWGVILFRSEEEPLALPWMGDSPIQVVALVLLLAGGLMWLVTRQIVTPLKELAATAQKLGSGDLTATIPVTGQDEIGELAGSLDTMRLQLKHSLDEISGLNRELEKRVEQRTGELRKLDERLHQQNQERGELLRKIISSQEEERQRIARELHDEVGQSITSLMIGFRVLETQDPAKMKQGIAQLKILSAHTLDEVRHLALELRPSSIDDLGLIAALQQYTREYTEKFGVAADFQASGFEGKRLRPELEIALYRIVQEALTNVAKHADARRVSILMGIRDSSIVAIVEDNGAGFDVQSVLGSRQKEKKLGLYGMQERAGLIGGVLTIESTPGKGTTIFVEVPLKGDESK